MEERVVRIRQRQNREEACRITQCGISRVLPVRSQWLSRTKMVSFSRSDRHLQAGENARGAALRDDDGDRVRGGSVVDDADTGTGCCGVGTDGKNSGPRYEISAGFDG